MYVGVGGPGALLGWGSMSAGDWTSGHAKKETKKVPGPEKVRLSSRLCAPKSKASASSNVHADAWESQGFKCFREER